MKKRMIQILLAATVLGMLGFGLWPFDFFPKNKVEWVRDGNGLRFDGKNQPLKKTSGGVAVMPSPLGAAYGESGVQGELTLGIWLEPAEEPRGRRARIVSFLNQSKEEVLFLGQWRNHLLMRQLVPGAGGAEEWKEIGVDKVLKKNRACHVSVVFGKVETAIYVDGERMATFPNRGTIGEAEDLWNCSFALGNSPDCKNPWSGNIYGVVLYDLALSEGEILQCAGSGSREVDSSRLPRRGLAAAYTFKEGKGAMGHDVIGNGSPIQIPDHPQISKRVLSFPELRHLEMGVILEDVGVNVVGFMPLGFFYGLLMCKKREWTLRKIYLSAVVTGALVTLLIELMQVFLPTRYSSLMDLICNTVGTGLGVVVFHALMAKREGKSYGATPEGSG